MRRDRSDRLLGAFALGVLIVSGGAVHAASVTVSFDTLPDGTSYAAPTAFASTMPLRDEYAQADGVHFLGGGGVLSGNFGVSGISPTNFLAFNTRSIAHYSDGVTIPTPPEQIRFDQPANLVRVSVGSSEGGTATLTAYDANGNSVATAQLPLTPTLTPLSVQSTSYNIVSVQIALSGSRSMVVDSLVFMIQDHTNLPPVTQCALDGPAGSNGVFLGDVHATLTATDPDDTVAATHYRLDGSDWQPYAAPVLISGTGTHTLDFQSLDSGGLWENIQTQSVKIDATSPVTQCALDGPAGSNGAFLGDVHATLTATDPDDTVAATRYRLDSQNAVDWQSYSNPVLISGTGTHTLQFQSLDGSGNWEDVKSVTVPIDMTKPVTQCTLDGLAGATGVYRGDVHATLTATDPDDTVAATHYRLDGSDWQPYAAPVLISGTGTHTLQFQSLDSSGNWEDVQSQTVTIDATSPEVNLTVTPGVHKGSSGRLNQHLFSVVVNGSATDEGSGMANLKFKVKDDYGVVQPVVSHFGQMIRLASTLKPRDRYGRCYRVTVTATDNAGNQSTVTHCVWVLRPGHSHH